MREDFNRWLNAELDARRWSQTDAATAGKFSASMLSKVLNGYANPGLDFCAGIALAFGVSVEEVQRRAGLLTGLTDLPDGAKSWGARLAALPEDKRGRVVAAMDDVLGHFENVLLSRPRLSQPGA
jgi:transcriptional regulator with XRE-family HTH domain